MKKFILIASLALLFTAGTASANTLKKEIPSTVQNSFNRFFAQATEVNWEESATWFKASFQLNGLYLTAYYAPDGRPIAISRNLTTSNLPLHLLGHLKQYMSNAWVSDLFELSSHGNSTYYVTLDNADETLTLVSDGNDWSVYNRITKG